MRGKRSKLEKAEAGILIVAKSDVADESTEPLLSQNFG
jgi:hypothetical protein